GEKCGLNITESFGINGLGFSKTLALHLEMGIPCIVGFDMNKFVESGGYLNGPELSVGAGNDKHVVLAVGYRWSEEYKDYLFAVMDSGAYPFLVTRGATIFNSAFKAVGGVFQRREVFLPVYPKSRVLTLERAFEDLTKVEEKDYGRYYGNNCSEKVDPDHFRRVSFTSDLASGSDNLSWLCSTVDGVNHQKVDHIDSLLDKISSESFDKVDPFRLDVSIISSLSVDGLSSSEKMMPEGVDVDLYAFMQGDNLCLLGSSSNSDVEAMSSLANCDEDRLADITCKIKNALSGRNLRGIASFIPEISSNDPSEREKAHRALIFLTKFVDFWNKRLDEGQPNIKYIELVGGNTVGEIWLDDSSPATENSTIVFSEEKRQCNRERIIEVLSKTIEATASSNVLYSLELEPGELAALNSVDEIHEILDLAKSKKVIERCGVNIDIAHYGILSNYSTTDPRIQDLKMHVVSAHISDHSRGHFADLMPLLDNGESLFIKWLRFLKEINEDPSCEKFSGHLAIELEACAEKQQAYKAFKITNYLINQ
ncbi:MAG: hypothetical protein AAF226_00405, partial [Verrucomicrobiota bacterium]